MKRPLLIATCVALGFTLAAPARGLEPGEKWLECYVGQGGQASVGELFAAVARALDGDDVLALERLGLDQCAFLRAGTLLGWDYAQRERDGMRALTADGVHDLHARLAVEGVRLADHPGAEVKLVVDLHPEPDAELKLTVSEDEPPMRIVSTASPLAVRFAVTMVDARWYLAGIPSFTNGGSAVVERLRALLDGLGGALARQRTKPAAAARALETWWKKHGAELERVARAGRTLQDEAHKAALAAQREDLGKRIGSLKDDPAIAARLASLLPLGSLGVGVPECDRYLADFMRCAKRMPAEAQQAMSEAMLQVVEAWRQTAATPNGRAVLVIGCREALVALYSGVGDSMCPGMLTEPIE